MTLNKIPLSELHSRMSRFRAKMDATYTNWEMAAITSGLNLLYLAGSMQEGMLLVPREGEAVYWVRRSYDRACDESLFPNMQPMESFRDITATLKKLPSEIFLETESVSLAFYQRFRKYFNIPTFKSVDGVLGAVRSIKSPYELKLMEEAGEIHRIVLEERIPTMLQEGMSEAQFGAELFPVLIAEGHHGVARFFGSETDAVVGFIGFGDSSIYPTSLNGPGGNRGMGPAVPVFGSRQRFLKKGDLVFIDIACGVEGYHTDKTQTYMFGKPLPDEAIAVHKQCVEIQDRLVDMLRPGAIPSEIYRKIIGGLSPEFLTNFMGYGNRRVKFLGHGVGLQVDEVPVIAEGFDEPLQEGMVLALEPKKGIKGVGMVGIEDTYLVTPNGGRSLTGNSRGLIPVF